MHTVFRSSDIVALGTQQDLGFLCTRYSSSPHGGRKGRFENEMLIIQKIKDNQNHGYSFKKYVMLEQLKIFGGLSLPLNSLGLERDVSVLQKNSY